MDLELISFKICPFVQRSAITLLHKGVEFRTTYIELASPPDWFPKISPFGKVPLLRVDGKHIIFESAVINEYVDDVTSDRLMPEDPLQRALNRAWIEFGSGLLGDMWQTMMAKDEAQFREKAKTLRGNLERLEMGAPIIGPWFNGDRFSLVDAACAPLWQRIAILNAHLEFVSLSGLDKVSAWSSQCVDLPETRSSVLPEFETLFLDYTRNAGSWVGQQLGR